MCYVVNIILLKYSALQHIYFTSAYRNGFPAALLPRQRNLLEIGSYFILNTTAARIAGSAKLAQHQSDVRGHTSCISHETTDFPMTQSSSLPRTQWGLGGTGALKPAVGASERGEGGPGWDETHHLLDDEHPEKKLFAFQHFAK